MESRPPWSSPEWRPSTTTVRLSNALSLSTAISSVDCCTICCVFLETVAPVFNIAAIGVPIAVVGVQLGLFVRQTLLSADLSQLHICFHSLDPVLDTLGQIQSRLRQGAVNGLGPLLSGLDGQTAAFAQQLRVGFAVWMALAIALLIVRVSAERSDCGRSGSR